MGVKSYPSSMEREIVTVKGCKIKTIGGKVYLEKGKSVRPLYKLFERYIGDWINLKIMESELNGWLEREGETVKLKIISAKENGEIKGQCKWRKRKHHEWKWEDTSIDEFFKRYVGSYVDVRVNPNVLEIGHGHK